MSLVLRFWVFFDIFLKEVEFVFLLETSFFFLILIEAY